MIENNARTLGLFNKTDQTINITNVYMENKSTIPSLMPKFIEILYNNVVRHNPETELSLTAALIEEYDVEDKIKFNDLKKYRYIAEDYGTYYTCCKDSLNTLDDNFLDSKQRILFTINEYYKAEKRLLLSNINEKIKNPYDIVKRNSDLIIDNIKNKLESEIEKDYNGENICSEDIKYCLPIFLCFAFMECKILEKRPKK